MLAIQAVRCIWCKTMRGNNNNAKTCLNGLMDKMVLAAIAFLLLAHIEAYMSLRIPQRLNFFATTLSGLEDVLAKEVKTLHAVSNVQIGKAGVMFDGTEATGFDGLLKLRSSLKLMERIGMTRPTEVLRNADDLYDFAASFAWESMITPSMTIKCDCVLGQDIPSSLSHTLFSSLTIKNAIVDRFRDLTGTRPSVDTANPELLVLAYLHRQQGMLYRVWSGEDSMHKRGYRTEAIHKAAMRETTAAALLLASGYEGMLCDPMCGSGTFAIEAALLAAQTAPGLIRYADPKNNADRRPWPSPTAWLDVEQGIWEERYAVAVEADQRHLATEPVVLANDLHPASIKLAKQCAVYAGVEKMISFSQVDISQLSKKVDLSSVDAVLTNPPWDLRLEEQDAWDKLDAFMHELADLPDGRHRDAWIVSGNPNLQRAISFPCQDKRQTKVGGVELTLCHYLLENRRRW